MKARILIVEDELPMRVALQDVLKAEGYRTLTAPEGESGLNRAIHEQPDLILLDVMLPKLDGYALCAELRRLEVATPVLMLTAKAQVRDRVTGLDSGADDYLVKPFSTEELLARVRALLRRVREKERTVTGLRLRGAGPSGLAIRGSSPHAGQKPGGSPEGLAPPDVEIDFVKLTASRGGEDLRLTAKEFAVLRLLAEAAGAPVTRGRFLDLVWGHAAFPSTRTVDNHIATLRAKIEPDPEAPRWIQTVHGIGYRLAPDSILQNPDKQDAGIRHDAVEEKS